MGAMYPDELTQPMRHELTSNGITELVTADDVQNDIVNTKGIVVALINSVCGCAAGAARPGFIRGVQSSEIKPEKAVTAFAGVHPEAVAALRAQIPAPPSSPAIAVFKDGKPIMMMHRSDIEVRDANAVAEVVKAMLKEAMSAEAA